MSSLRLASRASSTKRVTSRCASRESRTRRCSTSIPLRAGASFTIEVLIKPRTAGSAEQRFLHIEDARSARVLLELRIVSPQEWALDTFLFDSQQSRLTLLDRTKAAPDRPMALGGADIRWHDDDALRGWCARARGPARLSCDGAGQDVAGCATQQGELVPGLHARDSLTRHEPWRRLSCRSRQSTEHAINEAVRARTPGTRWRRDPTARWRWWRRQAPRRRDSIPPALRCDSTRTADARRNRCGPR